VADPRDPHPARSVAALAQASISSGWRSSPSRRVKDASTPSGALDSAPGGPYPL